MYARIYPNPAMRSVLVAGEGSGVDFIDLGVDTTCKAKVTAQNPDHANGAEVVALPILRVEANRLWLADANWADDGGTQYTVGPLDANEGNGDSLIASVQITTADNVEILAGENIVADYDMKKTHDVLTEVGYGEGGFTNGDGTGGNTRTHLNVNNAVYFLTTTNMLAHVRIEGQWSGADIELVSRADGDGLGGAGLGGFWATASGIELASSDNVGTTGHAIPIASLGKYVVSADVYVAWRGLNTDLPTTELASLNDTTAIEAVLGTVWPSNPLALAMHVAISNSGGVNIDYLPVATDDAAGFTGALSTLNASPAVYAMIPLSDDLSGVIIPYKNAAVAMSTPKKGKFRIAVGSTELVPDWKNVSGTATAPEAGGTVVSGQTAFSAAGADFITAGVAKNDEVIKVIGDGVGTPFTSAAVGTVTKVTGAETLTISAASVALANETFYIRRSIASNPDARAQAVVDLLAGANDKRLIMTYPAVCNVLDFTAQPGYYLSAALGGLLAALPAHRPLNQIGLASITNLVDSNIGAFDVDQIDKISDGGYFVFIADDPNGTPYCVHQLTSAAPSFPGVQEYTEVSVVRNFDFVSAFFKARLDPYVGVWNVIPSAFSSIQSTLAAGILDLRGRTSDFIGAPLLSGQVDFIRQSEADAGTLEGSITIRLPKVLNKLVIHLISA